MEWVGGFIIGILFQHDAVSVCGGRHPIIRWAQRKDKVYLEVQLRDIKGEKIDLSEQGLTFEGESDKDKYAFSLDLFAVVDKEDSKWSKTGYHLLFVLEKKDKDAAFWPRLTKEKVKNQYIQIDWSKWVDEDEEEEEPDKGLGGFDPSMMQSTPPHTQTSEAACPVWAAWAECPAWVACLAWAVWVVCPEWEEWACPGWGCRGWGRGRTCLTWRPRTRVRTDSRRKWRRARRKRPDAVVYAEHSIHYHPTTSPGTASHWISGLFGVTGTE